jgi:hypothetical protein
MPEIENNQATSEVADQQSTSENSQAGADQETGTNNTATDTGVDKGTGEQDTSKGQELAKAPTETPGDDNQEPSVRTRLSKQDFIIGRQKAKLAKSQEKTADADEYGGDMTIASEDEEMISRVVAKQFAPIIDKSLADDDNKEIMDFINENPDFKPYETKARRFMQHPSRRNLPVKSIFYEVAGDDLIKIGAQRSKIAEEKAKQTQTGGGSNRSTEGTTNDWNLSETEFQAKQERIRRGV